MADGWSTKQRGMDGFTERLSKVARGPKRFIAATRTGPTGGYQALALKTVYTYTVRGHSRLAAYGTGRANRRPVSVGSYTRRRRALRPKDEEAMKKLEAPRSAGKNALIFNALAKGVSFDENSGKRRRMPPRSMVKLVLNDMAQINALWMAGSAQYGATGDARMMLVVAKQVADLIVATMRQRVMAGGLAPVKERTQKRKDSEVGPGKPAGVRTGQLLASLTGTAKAE